MNLARMRVLLIAVGAAGGCTAYPTMTPASINCDIESPYVLDSSKIPLNQTYTGASPTVGATATVGQETIPDGAVCSQATALVIRAYHNNDWGALAGFYNFGPVDASAYLGVSFWARAPGPTNKSFTLALDDSNTAVDATSDAGTCIDYSQDGGMITGTGTIIDQATGMPIGGVSSTAPPPDSCGNSYATVMNVTTGWVFYTFPFTVFHQAPQPNRVPNDKLPNRGPLPDNGLLTNKLMNIIFRMPREATTELWVAKLSFYRNKTPSDLADAGAGSQ
jgi:hypothetical protein